jgi:hypothetical protein
MQTSKAQPHDDRRIPAPTEFSGVQTQAMPGRSAWLGRSVELRLLIVRRSPTVSRQVIDRLPVKMTSMYPMELLLLSLYLIPLRDLPLV